MLWEILNPLLIKLDSSRIRNNTTNCAWNPSIVNNFGFIIVLLAKHTDLIWSFKFLLIDILDDIMRLSSQKLLLEFLWVDLWSQEWHLSTIDNFLNVWINLTHGPGSSMSYLRRFRSIDIFSSQQNFIESRNFFCSSTLEELTIYIYWSLLIFDYCVYFSYCKVNSFGELILVVDFNPLFYILCLNGLDKLWDV